ncbi:MAG TPA: hypothetical protein VEL07_19440 [Planctomycetota bacterium]|nr:hypothetical protein [Planctomycetota bacterium]
MQDGAKPSPPANASSCHVEQNFFCVEELLTRWMAGRSPERCAPEALAGPKTIRNWLGIGQRPSTPRMPIRPHLARLFGVSEDDLDRAIAATERRREAATGQPSQSDDGTEPINGAGEPT